MVSRKARKSLTGTIIPIGIIILAIFLGAASYSVVTSNGWSFPYLGIPGFVSSSNSTSSSTGTTTINISGTSGQTLIPPNQIGVQIVVTANNQDGTNSTLSQVATGNLPTLALVNVNGKPIRSVVAQALVGVSAPNGEHLPAGSIAIFDVNFTAVNENSRYTKWNYVEETVSYTDNGTLALLQLPLMELLPWEAFTDYCGNLANGTLACTNGPTAVSHRIDWTLYAKVTTEVPSTILPGQFSILPQIQGSSITSADFSLSGTATVCSNCGGVNSAPISPTVNPSPGTNSPGKQSPSNPRSIPDTGCYGGSLLPGLCILTSSPPVPSPTDNPSMNPAGSNPNPNPSVPNPSSIPDTGCYGGSLLPGFCVLTSNPTNPNGGGNGGGNGGNSSHGAGVSAGSGHESNGKGGGGYSLLPNNFVTLSDVAGVSVVLNWNLIMSLIVIIVVILGAVGVYVYSATRPRRRVR
jgi:uncharacterized membrane protein YgcG